MLIAARLGMRRLLQPPNVTVKPSPMFYFFIPSDDMRQDLTGYSLITCLHLGLLYSLHIFTFGHRKSFSAIFIHLILTLPNFLVLSKVLLTSNFFSDGLEAHPTSGELTRIMEPNLNSPILLYGLVFN